MADVCMALTFVGVHGEAFCFVDDFAQAQDEVDTDAFVSSNTLLRFIQCPDQSFLIFNETEAKFDMKELTVGHSCSEYKLHIKFYKDVSPNSNRGRAVTLYALQGDKKYAAVCKNDTEVYAKEIKDELDGRIEGSQHAAVFYMVRKSTNKFQFKSSLNQQRVLGFGPSDSGLKLMLCPNDENSEQETFTVSENM